MSYTWTRPFVWTKGPGKGKQIANGHNRATISEASLTTTGQPYRTGGPQDWRPPDRPTVLLADRLTDRLSNRSIDHPCARLSD